MTHRYMLDTNIVSNVLRFPLGAAARKFRTFGPDELCVSVVVAMELRFGAVKLGSQRLLEQIEMASRLYATLPLDDRVTGSYAAVRVGLERLGTPIGPLDTIIAAHALTLDLPLVTDNVAEFSRVQGLRVENWLD